MAVRDEIPFERLVDWLEGRLSDQEADTVAQQVAAAGPEVQAQVAWLRAFAQVSDNLILAAPPRSVRHTLAARFAAYAREKRRPNFLERLVAVLAFDSVPSLSAAGVRGESDGPRQLLFATERLDVVLTVQPQPQAEDVDLLGQILPKAPDLAPEAFAVQLVQAESEVAIAMADDLGEFGFAALAPGTYQLAISGDALEVALPAFELRP